jgi:peptide/nickel transport system ATP-binding protein
MKREVAGASHLTKHFRVSSSLASRLPFLKPRKIVRAVDDVSFKIAEGETFALIGESGSGKSTIARCLAGVLRPTSGHALVLGHDLSRPSDRRTALAQRRNIQMIFQDPYSSLNPRWRVEDIIAEPLRTHSVVRGGGKLRDNVAELLLLVGMSPQDAKKFPHEFSGGQRQRISIARALSIGPAFIIADEPTAALDVSVQGLILNLLQDLQARLGLTLLFISHNLAAVSHLASSIGVLYFGRLAESGPAALIMNRPLHPYTRLLLDSVPDIEMPSSRKPAIPGEPPNPIAPPSGCAFHPRCPYAADRCKEERPLPQELGGVQVACHEAGRFLRDRAPAMPAGTGIAS